MVSRSAATQSSQVVPRLARFPWLILRLKDVLCFHFKSLTRYSLGALQSVEFTHAWRRCLCYATAHARVVVTVSSAVLATPGLRVLCVALFFHIVVYALHIPALNTASHGCYLSVRIQSNKQFQHIRMFTCTRCRRQRKG